MSHVPDSPAARNVRDWLISGGVGGALSVLSAVAAVATAISVGAMHWVRAQIRASISDHNVDAAAHPQATTRLSFVADDLDEINRKLDDIFKSNHKRANQSARMQYAQILIAEKLGVQLPRDEDEGETQRSEALDLLFSQQREQRKRRRAAAIGQAVAEAEAEGEGGVE